MSDPRLMPPAAEPPSHLRATSQERQHRPWKTDPPAPPWDGTSPLQREHQARGPDVTKMERVVVRSPGPRTKRTV